MSKFECSNNCVDHCTSFPTNLTTVYAIVLLMFTYVYLCLLDALSYI